MYENNVLAKALRSASVGRESNGFAYDIDGNIIRTYEQLWSNSETLATKLMQAGIKPDDRVVVQLPKSIEMIELYLAAVLCGAIFVPLNTAYTEYEMDYFIEDTSPSILVIDDSKKEALIKYQSSHTIIWTTKDILPKSMVAHENLTNTPFQSVKRTEQCIASLLYTSGTTGRSKGAMLSHGALSSNAAVLKSQWGFSEKDILIHALPIFHIHGLYVAMNVSLLTGSQIIFMPSFDTKTIINCMSKATVLMGVPTFYTRLLTEENLTKATSSMRLFISGSAPLLAETHEQWFEQTGHKILERYGMTETNMITSNPLKGERKPGTVGTPLPGIEVIISDTETGEQLDNGQDGLIEVRGPNLFSGYWNMPEKTKEELRSNGFFITGDLGHFDKDGYLSILGRSKDLIISGGYNIYPKEIELLIDELPEVIESAVFGVTHPDFGETVVAVCVLNEQSTLTTDEIQQSLSHKLARFKQPRGIFLVDELPRNIMGKVQKNILREQYKSLYTT